MIKVGISCIFTTVKKSVVIFQGITPYDGTGILLALAKMESCIMMDDTFTHSRATGMYGTLLLVVM